LKIWLGVYGWRVVGWTREWNEWSIWGIMDLGSEGGRRRGSDPGMAAVSKVGWKCFKVRFGNVWETCWWRSVFVSCLDAVTRLATLIQDVSSLFTERIALPSLAIFVLFFFNIESWRGQMAIGCGRGINLVTTGLVVAMWPGRWWHTERETEGRDRNEDLFRRWEEGGVEPKTDE